MTEDVANLLSGIAGGSGVEAASAAETLDAFELLTVDPDGWPHVAWLGPGEVLPVGVDKVAVAVWPGSSTRRNLGNGRAVLQAVIAGMVYRLRLEVIRLGPVPVGDGALEGFLGTVEEVLIDEVGYAEVLSGLSYRLLDPSPALERWAEQVSSLAQVVSAHLKQDPSGGDAP